MTKTIQLIMSGAIVSQELAAEFGPLPPSFLPIGSQPLYELQAQALPNSEPIYLVLPDAFNVPTADIRRLNELGITIISLPPDLSLGEAIVYALNSVDFYNRSVRILHGDTLISEFPWEKSDILAVGFEGDDYVWAEVDLEGDRIRALATAGSGTAKKRGRIVASGYFHFSSGVDLIQSINLERGDFVAAINRYLVLHEIFARHAATWIDFGHLQTYFQGRLVKSTARSFNTVTIDGRTAKKTSENPEKILSEVEWFNNVPPAIKIFTARLIESGIDPSGRLFYDTAYEYLPSLSELFVFGVIGLPVWTRIFESCATFLRTCAAYKNSASADAAMQSLTSQKTLERLETFARHTNFPIGRELSMAGRPMPSLLRIAEELSAIIGTNTGRSATVMHGDLCFSNILYDSRVRRIRVIDPRGSSLKGQSIYGDVKYDIAKLSHSIVGRYDVIIADRHSLKRAGEFDFEIQFDDAPHQQWLEDALMELQIDEVRGSDLDVQASMNTLFLSMLPLHNDRTDRQFAFIANALRLYRNLERH